MSELVTCVLAALNGFCAVWKLAMNDEFRPNGLFSGVPKSSGGCASAELQDITITTVHTVVMTFRCCLMFPSRGKCGAGATYPVRARRCSEGYPSASSKNADHAALVLLRLGADAAGVPGAGDLPQRLGPPAAR